MRISILSMCNFMGRPVEAGDVIDAVSPSEAAAAWYLVSIDKAKVLNSNAVIEVDAEEEPSHTRARQERADRYRKSLSPDPSPMQGEGSDDDEE